VTFKLTGDFAKLRGFEKQIRQSPKVLQIISQNLAEETIELIREGFTREQEPSGKPWKPLKYRSGKILQDTGRLRSSWHRTRASKRGFTVASAVKYAPFHQTGTRRGLAARPMVPNKKLPLSWRNRYVETAQEILTEHFR